MFVYFILFITSNVTYARILCLTLNAEVNIFSHFGTEIWGIALYEVMSGYFILFFFTSAVPSFDCRGERRSSRIFKWESRMTVSLGNVTLG